MYRILITPSRISLTHAFCCVEMEGEVIHRTENIGEFYYEFGYTPGMMHNLNAITNLCDSLAIEMIPQQIAPAQKLAKKIPQTNSNGVSENELATSHACTDSSIPRLCH
jgi:hypothetical protein